MKPFDCSKMRAAVSVAVTLLLAGILLQIPRALFGADFPAFTTLLSGIGLVTVVSSPVVLLAIGLLATMPSVARDLALCDR
ncbi:MAG: hypothetical protein H6959_07030 [Chromatiaceae bacterium]|nr:hypothetical protein [Gammaproteobacteria bacterium]MCP5300584.1 hypothetical protein [Chromatiaceae bacterium]MCP5422656.1 hypothetical protein [Chromatiaceae bacterium]